MDTWTPEAATTYAAFRVALREADGDFNAPKAAEAFRAFQAAAPGLIAQATFAVPLEVEAEVERRIAQMEAEKPFHEAASEDGTEPPPPAVAAEAAPDAPTPGWMKTPGRRWIPPDVQKDAQEDMSEKAEAAFRAASGEAGVASFFARVKADILEKKRKGWVPPPPQEEDIGPNVQNHADGWEA